MNPFRWAAHTVGDLLFKFFPVAAVHFLTAGGNVTGIFRRRNPSQFSLDGYAKNIIAFKCIRGIARAVGRIPLVVKVNGQKVEEHPLLDLLKRPNSQQGGAAFWETLISFYLIVGDTYIVGFGPDGKPPQELWVLRPDRMRVVPGKYGPGGYVYDYGGVITRWECDPIKGTSDIFHKKTFNPLDDWYGQSPMEAGAYAIDSHNDALAWNQSLLQNSARPSGALVYDSPTGAQLGDKQRKTLKEELTEAYMGPRNAGRPMFLENVKWQPMSLTPADLDYVNGINLSARNICYCFDYPPILLGIPGDSTYANGFEARQALYEDTVIPLLDTFLDDLNRWLAPAFGDNVEIGYDDTNIAALADRRAKLITAATASTFHTVDEKRAMCNLEPLSTKESKQVWIPTGLMPLEGAMDPPDPAEGLPGAEDGDPKDPAEAGEKPEGTPAKPAKGAITKKYAFNYERILNKGN